MMSENKIWDMEVISDHEVFEYVEYSVNSWKRWIAKTMSEIENVELKEIKLLTYFSILEMMAQEYDNFPSSKLQDSFSKFVLRFQNKYDFLEAVDPVSLFYRVEDIVSEKVNLNDFVDGEIYFPNYKILSDKVIEIKGELIKKKGKEYTEKKLKEHRYVDLLYRMRCRLSHEFSAPHISFSKVIEKPSYINCTRQYVGKGRLVSDDVWQLRFPVKFMKDLCMNCFENYLDYCLRERIPPDKNNGVDRLCELSWYSK